MSITWNDSQKKAIEGRGGTMLVSAAAGSGKTAVLVERVIRRLCDTENPCNIEDLLIVTFTRAAAAQMKEKITAALRKKIAEQPGNKALQKNLFMLPYANISTIDSFCIGLVRDNYHKLGISPDFRILESGRKTVLYGKAMQAVLDSFHNEREEEFRALNRAVNDSVSDSKITEHISALYEKSRGCVFPHAFLEGIALEYEENRPPEQTAWGKSAFLRARKYLDSLLSGIDRGLEIAASDPFTGNYYDALCEDRLYIESLRSAAAEENWDKTARILSQPSFRTVRKNGKANEDVINAIKAIRNYNKKDVIASNMPEFTFASDEIREITARQAPVVRTLTDAVLCYEQALSGLKNEANSYTFDDMLHFTLDLLVRNENEVPVRTELARELSESFEEILVDEYQDVSRAQDALFFALSRDNKNRFMVGDVKQSIYSFRLATPEVFTDLRKQMADFDGVHYPARVSLSANYRSRKGVTDTVNFIFSQIMTESAGGVDYRDGEELNPQAGYPECPGPCAEAYLLEGENKYDTAVFAANYIKNAVENKMQITASDGVTMRDASYGDFCLLVRSLKAGGIYSEVFRNAGIPLIIESDTNLLSTPEIMFTVSFLRVIDNPVNDVPLTAVLLSPVFGFTPDELSEMRIASRSGKIYSCVRRSAAAGNEKAKRFLDTLTRLRRLAVNLPAGEFVNRLIEESGYRAAVCAMSGCELRTANLDSFIKTAQDYESGGIKGIAAFLRFIDTLEENGGTKVSCSQHTGAADAVTMSTIHKSKGLEYPVVILCECNKKYNEKDLNSSLLATESCGVGLRDIRDRVRYETPKRIAIKEEIKQKQRSEELRILYVALTRAKEKLVITAHFKSLASFLKKLPENITGDDTIAPQTVNKMGNYAQIIFTALLRHPDAHLLRKATDAQSLPVLRCESRMSFEFVNDITQEQGTDEEPKVFYEKSDTLLKEIEERLSFTYPYSGLDGIKAKRIASDFEDEGLDMTYFASEKPAFTSSTGLTPAQRGTATHRFMQYADYRLAAKNVSAELERLTAEGLLTKEEADAVDEEPVRKFFSSDVAARILALPEKDVFREFSFTASLPLEDVYPDIDPALANGEVIVIEGVADCAFIENGKLVILDYKTDRAQSLGELAVRYAPQLSTYRKCLSQVFNMPVSETLIYSFRFGSEIKIK